LTKPLVRSNILRERDDSEARTRNMEQDRLSRLLSSLQLERGERWKAAGKKEVPDRQISDSFFPSEDNETISNNYSVGKSLGACDEDIVVEPVRNNATTKAMPRVTLPSYYANP
jgi:hypothetical protein